MSQSGKIISRSFFMLCATLLFATSLALPSLAMDQEQDQTEKVEKGADDDGSTVIGGMGVAGGYGDSDRDRERQPPSTSIPVREIVAWTAAGVLGVCVLGMTGGWVGEHFTHRCDPEIIMELCQMCGEACSRICIF